jgi:hypothetical protein
MKPFRFGSNELYVKRADQAYPVRNRITGLTRGRLLLEDGRKKGKD